MFGKHNLVYIISYISVLKLHQKFANFRDSREGLNVEASVSYYFQYRRDSVVVIASTSQSVDLEFTSPRWVIPKNLKNGIHSFPEF